MREYKNGDYGTMSGFLTGMIFDSLREESKVQDVPETIHQSTNVTININIDKDSNVNATDIIKAIVDKLR